MWAAEEKAAQQLRSSSLVALGGPGAAGVLDRLFSKEPAVDMTLQARCAPRSKHGYIATWHALVPWDLRSICCFGVFWGQPCLVMRCHFLQFWLNAGRTADKLLQAQRLHVWSQGGEHETCKASSGFGSAFSKLM